jgi:hypothetical protein
VNTQPKIIPQWIYTLVAFFFLFYALLSFSDALFEIQNLKVAPITSSNWGALLSLLLVLLFGLGWGLPIYGEKFNHRYFVGRNIAIASVVLAILEIALLVTLHPHRFAYHAFVASSLITASGVSFGLSSTQKRKAL